MPVTKNNVRLKNRNGLLDRNQHDNGGNNLSRRGRLQGNTQRAMVGIVIIDRVHVRDLNDNQNRQQSQAQERDCVKTPSLCAPISAVLSPTGQNH